MADVPASAGIASSDLRARLTWFLDRLRDGGSELTDDALSGVWVTELPAPPPGLLPGAGNTGDG